MASDDLLDLVCGEAFRRPCRRRSVAGQQRDDNQYRGPNSHLNCSPRAFIQCVALVRMSSGKATFPLQSRSRILVPDRRYYTWQTHTPNRPEAAHQRVRKLVRGTKWVVRKPEL